MSNSITNFNFNCCCRICLAADGTNFELFCSSDEKMSVVLKIMTCAQVQVMKNDGLPQKVCGKCLKQLDEVCEFLKLIQSSDFQLRKYLKDKTHNLVRLEESKKSPKSSHSEQLGNDMKNEHTDDIQNEEVLDNEDTNYNCDECSKSFQTVNSLRTHKRTYIESRLEESEKSPKSSHSEQLENEPTDDIQNEEVLDNQDKNHTCDECSKSFKTLNSLRTHKRTHKETSLKCPQCDKVFAYRRLLLQHRLVHTNVRSFVCPQCNKSFKTKPQLKIHCRRHLNERPFQCNYCDKKFFQMSHKNQHLRVHTNERPFSCDVCKKSFRNQSGLKGHMQKHTGIQPYQCQVCGKKFSLKSSLTNHANLHSGEKPLVCEHCGRSFASLSSLKTHLKAHIGGNMCEECGKKFSSPTHLEEHRRTHGVCRDFVCSSCGKSFKQSVGLAMHLKTHNPERPYQCDLCEKSFTMRKTFEVHYRRHSGEKPYKCDDCGKSFRQSSTLKTHSKLHKKHPCECGTWFDSNSQLSKHKENCGERTNSLETFDSKILSTNNQSPPGLIEQRNAQSVSSVQPQPP